MSTPEPSFSVITGTQVERVLRGREKIVIDTIDAAYRLHGAKATVNPPSYFLTFPERPMSRIIALPASIAGDDPVDGIKWISSFPENIASGLPRASAVLILNDPRTGYPMTCMEASIISAARTAASAALAARVLSRTRERPRRLAIVGLGLIARYVLTYLTADGWDFDELNLYDIDPCQARSFASGPAQLQQPGSVVRVHSGAASAVAASDLVLLATIAATPYLDAPDDFAHHPLVLHVSLRDLAPSVILTATNYVDDVDHCLRASTSVHLTEQHTGNRDFLAGTLYDVATGVVEPPGDRTIVFSPFGLGVLDLAVAQHVWHEANRRGEVAAIPGFFRELSRHG